MCKYLWHVDHKNTFTQPRRQSYRKQSQLSFSLISTPVFEKKSLTSKQSFIDPFPPNQRGGYTKKKVKTNTNILRRTGRTGAYSIFNKMYLKVLCYVAYKLIYISILRLN